ncbi:unnamed protein product [Trichobilharzia szidati]|nr:unnamed protein product [Trichobilharzia szidati]
MPFGSETPLFTLNKWCNFFGIDLTWACEENGAYHNKVFRVTLIVHHHSLPDSEVYFGIGKRILEAKHRAAENALLSCKLFEESRLRLELPKTEKSCVKPKCVKPFIILIESASTPDPPKLQLKQLLALLGSKVKFIQSGRSADNALPIMYTATVGIVGRQYVGNATTKPGAEQEACIGALAAIRRSLLSFIKRQKTKKGVVDDSNIINICQYIHPESPSWRLHILAGLHFIYPRFKVKKLTGCEPSGYTCTCVLDGWGSTESLSISAKKAQDSAAQAMLNKLNQTENKCSTVQSSNWDSNAASQCVHKKNVKSGKTKLQLNLNRATDESVHPVCRLECFRASKRLDKIKYTLLNEQLQSGMQGSLVSGRSSFVYQIEFLNECIQGPAANNKRLAKRLAAEALLTKLGLSSEKVPEVKSALRTAEVSFLDNDGVENILRNSSHGDPVPTETNGNGGRSESLPNQTVHSKDYHVNFSCTSDTFVFSEEEGKCNSLGRRNSHPVQKKGVKSKVLYNKQNPRCYSSMNLSMNEMHNFMQNHYVSSTSSRLSLPNSTSDREHNKSYKDFGVFDKTIGYWTDSKKLKCSLRSCSQSNSENDLSGNHWHRKSDRLSDSAFPNVSLSCTHIKTNIRLQLLARVAAYCLKEHVSYPSLSMNMKKELLGRTNVSLVDQLVLLCKRLSVPCHFIDYPPTFYTGHKKQKEIDLRQFEHTVILLVGINPTNYITTLNYSQMNDGYISVKASDFTRSIARQKAVQLVVQCLAKLIE